MNRSYLLTAKEVYTMGNEKYTQKVMAAFQDAQQTAALHYNQEITSVHLMIGLTKDPEGLLASIFSDCKTDLPLLRAKLEQMLKKIPSVQGSSNNVPKLCTTITSARNICF